jgi:hypothetical protein
MLEVVLVGTGNPLYFGITIPIYCKKLKAKTSNNSLPSPLSIEEIIQQKNIPLYSIQDIGNNIYAFREIFFQIQFVSSQYTPIMHGTLKFDPSKGEVLVIVRLYWCVLFFDIFMIWNIFQMYERDLQESLFFCCMLFLINIAIYLSQVKNFRCVGESALQAWSQIK